MLRNRIPRLLPDAANNRRAGGVVHGRGFGGCIPCEALARRRGCSISLREKITGPEPCPEAAHSWCNNANPRASSSLQVCLLAAIHYAQYPSQKAGAKLLALRRSSDDLVRRFRGGRDAGTVDADNWLATPFAFSTPASTRHLNSAAYEESPIQPVCKKLSAFITCDFIRAQRTISTKALRNRSKSREPRHHWRGFPPRWTCRGSRRLGAGAASHQPWRPPAPRRWRLAAATRPSS